MRIVDRCPLMVVEWCWGLDPYAESQEPLPPRPCHAQLHLRWRLDVPLEGDETISIEDVAKNAVTDRWEVVCENGHTIATSSGEENAEPFTWSVVFGAVEAEKQETQ